jgi:hypothetical protein
VEADRSVAQADAARELAAELRRRWRRGEVTADAAAVLAEHPDLARHKSVVVDLAYEEYLLREKAGGVPEPGLFADRFPVFRGSIRNMLDAHRLLVEQPELLAPADEWPAAGAAFEGMKLLAELGSGAFGRAYLAHDTDTDRLCALKLTTGRSAEAQLMGRLAHPHVTEVYWARAVGHRTAVCMPFVGVSTLADVISAAFLHPGDPPPPTADVILAAAETDELAGKVARRAAPVVRPGESYLVGAAAVAARVAAAVAYLHDEGVVHADLKPSNVVVGPGGVPHLIDFNLSDGDGAPTTVRGTPAYMAPELLAAAASGRPAAEVDPVRADLFSLGVVVFELLTGRMPFPGRAGGGVAAPGTPAADCPSAPAMPPALPSAVAAALGACLSPDPASRPASALHLASVLDRFVHRRRTRGRRWLGFAAMCLGALVIAATAFAFLTGRPALSETPSQPGPLTADELTARGRERLRAGDRAGARADFEAAYGLSGSPWAKALVAYGLALEGQHVASAAAAEEALAGGARSAAVYNNKGYALAESSPAAAAAPGTAHAAIEPLDEALQLAPGMPAALYNRALAQYRGDLFAGRPVSPRAAADIAVALAESPTSPELHLDAARVYAVCSASDPSLRDKAVKQVSAAIGAGLDPVRCRLDAVLTARLRTNPASAAAFDAAVDTRRGPVPAQTPQLRLVEPRP